MSFRDLPSTREGTIRLLREILDRLERLEKGSAVSGLVSFGSTIQIGDIQLSSVPGAGNTRLLVAKNVKTGSTTTLATLT